MTSLRSPWQSTEKVSLGAGCLVLILILVQAELESSWNQYHSHSSPASSSLSKYDCLSELKLEEI